MSDTAPVLTDEQIDNMAATFSDAYLRTLPKFGHPVGKDLFDTWLAAVVARAKREERERVARELIAAANERGDTHNDSFVEGIRWAALCAEVNDFE